jgi:hypothetical protein
MNNQKVCAGKLKSDYWDTFPPVPFTRQLAILKFTLYLGSVALFHR